MISEEPTAKRTQRRRCLIVSSLAILLLVAAAVVPTGAAAQDNETYWENNTTVQNETWLEDNEEATAENTTNLLGRVGTFIIGSERGSAVGALLTSLMTGGIVLGMLGGSRLGMVGGSTVGVMTLGGMTAAGLAPPWMWALVMIGIGLILTQVLIGVLR